MTDINKNNLFYLNRDGRWPGFRLSGLDVRGDGTLQLSSLPMITSPIPDTVKNARIPDGCAGLAIDQSGTLFFTDPDSGVINRILGCDNQICRVPCLGTQRDSTSLNTPRGLFIPHGRQALFVADSGKHRLLIYDTQDFQILEIWGQTNAGAHSPGTADGKFDTPTSIAGDCSGNVYVVDSGNHRIQKFNSRGEVLPTFCANVSASGLLTAPIDIAVAEVDGAIRVFVVDSVSKNIFIFDASGKVVLNASGKPRVIQDDQHLKQPMGMAVIANNLYVGDNQSRRVIRFQLDETGKYVGAAIGYEGPVAALLRGTSGDLWVHPGGSLTPVKLDARKGYTRLGVLWLDPDPLTADSIPVTWHRIRAIAGSLPGNSHLDLYAYATTHKTDAPEVHPNSPNPFDDPRWSIVPYPNDVDVTELFISPPKQTGSEPPELRGKARYLWIGVLLSGDGTTSPRLEQLRVEFNYPSYSQFLPAVYRNMSNCGQFQERLLSLFSSFFGEVECEIDKLYQLFDPDAAPAGFLPWLAACLGLDLDDNWSEEKKREIIALIFELSGRRGTREGLLECLRIFAGVEAIIEEPLLNASWWALPGSDTCCQSCAESSADGGSHWVSTENSRLGWTTMLAPATAEGAVVGTSAVLDQSQLIDEEDFGSPLFKDVAYQFSVAVYRSQVMAPGALATIRAVIDSEKPAHTNYHLCVIDPDFRIGFQSRLGIDTVVAGPPRSLSLETDQQLGVDSVLAGPPSSLLGQDSRLGVSVRLA